MGSVLLSSRLCPHSLTHTVLHPKEPRAHCISVRSDRYCENCTSQQPEQCGLWHVGPCSPANRCTTARMDVPSWRSLQCLCNLFVAGVVSCCLRTQPDHRTSEKSMGRIRREFVFFVSPHVKTFLFWGSFCFCTCYQFHLQMFGGSLKKSRI